MRASDVLNRLQDVPFKPFRLHISDGSVVAIAEPKNIIVGKSSLCVPTAFERDAEGQKLVAHSRTVELSHIVEISANVGRKRKKK